MHECSLSVFTNSEREPAGIAGSAGEGKPPRSQERLSRGSGGIYTMDRSVSSSGTWFSVGFWTPLKAAAHFRDTDTGMGTIDLSEITAQHHWATTKLHAHHHRMQLRVQFQLSLSVSECICVFVLVYNRNLAFATKLKTKKKKKKNQPEIINTGSENPFPKCQSGSNKFKCERRALKSGATSTPAGAKESLKCAKGSSQFGSGQLAGCCCQSW